MTREPGRAPPRHAHGDLTSLAPHERLPEILVVPREKTPMCREPARDIPLVTKVMRKGARHTQRRDRASGVPPDILEHLPPKKTRVCLLYCFVLSPLTLLGAVPHHHLTLSVKELSLGQRYSCFSDTYCTLSHLAVFALLVCFPPDSEVLEHGGLFTVTAFRFCIHRVYHIAGHLVGA